MLAALSLRQFVIVDALDLEFASGFSVLTGETGAGKSILIDALLLALGERADADVVREGAARAEVSAEFHAPPAVAAWLAAQDLAADDPATLLVRRTVDAAGRSKAWINGTPATLAQLRTLAEALVDVHGQHAHQSLLRADAQRAMLDTHGGLSEAVQAVAAAHADWRRAARALDDAQAMAAGAAAEHDRLRWITDDLGALAPAEGEWDAAQTELKRLQHGASLVEGAQAAVDALSEADGAALERIDGVIARLQALVAFDSRLQAALDALQAARIQVDEAASDLQRYADRVELDAARLAEVDARVAALHDAARRFRTAPAGLPALLADARARLGALAAASDLPALQARAATAEAVYRTRAVALGKQRAAAARAMAHEVTRAMQDLSMAGGRFDVELTPADPAPHGLDKVEFLVAGHAGATPRPLARVASGGELARISLAISVIAATATPVPTLIFDEVDAGIGGAVADIVGRLLAQLGQQRQVLVVTHLPQVAAHGDQHLLVSKAADADGRPVSRIAPLDRKGRVEEVARMLGGVEITETTRRHARELLAG